MSRRLLNFMRLADGQPYTSPQAHEKRVGVWLKKSGFKEIKYQPYGTTCHPDWLVKDGNRWIEVECKTSLKSRISFNNTPPGRDTLYVFSSKRHNDTMLFYGGDVYKRHAKKTVQIFLQQVRKLEKKFTAVCLKSKRTNPYGFVPGFRLTLQQRGGMGSTDFFAPKTRELLVKKAKQRHI
jgi:hypothetical protein